ncbi:MAG TPA: A24 family peptidase [Nocardioides sp.]|nr:A24 family peptidase [Nocardioides sp.]
MSALVPALLGLVLCGLAGACTPYVIGRLPEPEPDPEPEEGVELTPAQQARLEEPPKELYADLARRSWVLPVAAGVSAVTGSLLGGLLGWDWMLGLLWLLVPVGALLGIVDWRTRLLPAIVVLPVTLVALLYGVGRWLLSGDHDDLVRGLVALLVVRSVFWVLWFVRQAGMGFGDVRLAALVGLVLGYAGWGEVLVGVYGAFVLFGVPGLVIAIVRRDRSMLKKGYPFGPFLLAGAVLGFAVGGPVVEAIYG